jgi:hypothetical protein
VIYFLRSPSKNLVKIGRTNYFRSRYDRLCYEHKEPLEILGVVSEDNFEERALHRLFKAIHHVNEWFRDEPVLRKFIAKHATLDLAAADTPRNDINVPIDRFIVQQAQKNAAQKNVSLGSYLSGLLRKPVDDDFRGF